jgi:aminopeptidase
VDSRSRHIRALAELAVGTGANVQPGQIVGLASEPGKEPLARAVAEAAYRRGAKYVDLSVFDVHLKRARALYGDPESLAYVPPWLGQRMLAIGELRGALVALSGPVAPRLMDDLDPALLGRDMLPRIPETNTVVNGRTVNWTIVPCPTDGWAQAAHPDLEPALALERLWDEVAHICRLDEDDPDAAWTRRLDQLVQLAGTLDRLGLDRLRYEGPGTDLTIGLLEGSRWRSGRMATVDGLVHAVNLPTEEVFTTPDPQRAEGTVRATKPLFTSGALITGLRVRFEGGRAVEIDADQGAGTLRALCGRDAGGARLGEVALVDRASRIGALGTVFFDTLLDENAASHVALGQAYEDAVDGEQALAQLNRSEIHIDFMIGSNELAITGVTRAGAEVPLLRDGAWQI